MTTAVRAILQQDILREIFSHLTPAWVEASVTDYPIFWGPSERQYLRSTLAASALVCRVFSEKALDALWRVLDDIVPLLRLLPCSGLHYNLRVHRDISDVAWSRFQGYARRVRELNSSEPSVPIHPSAWKILEQRLGGLPLLPMLRRLQALPQALPCVLLLSTTLEHLQFRASHEYYEDESVFPENEVFVNNLLRYLSLPCILAIRRGIHTAVPEASGHLQALGCFKSLQKIDLISSPVCVGNETLQALSSLSSLRGLRAYVSLGTISTSMFSNGFPPLVSISVRGTSEHLLKLLQAIPLQKLVEIDLDSETFETVEEYMCFVASVRSLVPAGLKSLTLAPEIFNDSAAMPSLADILQPMLSLRELRKVSCKFWDYPKDVSRDDLHVFANAWPKLNLFWAICTETIPNDVQPITVADLADFLQRCPYLESVGLATLDVTHLPSPDSVPRLDNGVRELEIQSFVGVAEVDLLAFALVIDRLLPCLSVPNSVTPEIWKKKSKREHWDKVRLLLASLRAARRIGN